MAKHPCATLTMIEHGRYIQCDSSMDHGDTSIILFEEGKIYSELGNTTDGDIKQNLRVLLLDEEDGEQYPDRIKKILVEESAGVFITHNGSDKFPTGKTLIFMFALGTYKAFMLRSRKRYSYYWDYTAMTISGLKTG